MFTAEKEELEQLGAEITTREIRQQPELWQETRHFIMKIKQLWKTF